MEHRLRIWTIPVGEGANNKDRFLVHEVDGVVREMFAVKHITAVRTVEGMTCIFMDDNGEEFDAAPFTTAEVAHVLFATDTVNKKSDRSRSR